jgi:hypothetical protein
VSARNRFPRVRLHADRSTTERGDAPLVERPGLTRRVLTRTERPTTPHVHLRRATTLCSAGQRKTARATRPAKRSAPMTAARVGSRETPKRDGRTGVAARDNTRRGRSVLKGNKPHERRPIDTKSRRATRPTGKRLGAATIGPMMKGRARSARASPIDSEGAGGRGCMTPRRTRESRGDAAG